MVSLHSGPSILSRFASLLLDLLLIHLALAAGIWLSAMTAGYSPQWESLRQLVWGLRPWKIPFVFPYTVVVPALTLLISGSYGIRLSKSTAETFYPVVNGTLATFFVFAMAVHFHRGNEVVNQYPTIALLLGLGLSQVGLIGWRVGARTVLRMQDRVLKAQINLLIVGLSGLDEETFNRITQNEFPNYNIIGYLEGRERDAFEFGGRVKKLGELAELVAIIDEEYVEEVLVVPSALSYDEFLNVIKVCELRSIDYRILPSYFDMVASRAQIDLINFVPLIHFGHPTISGWSNFLKRVFDLLVATVALILLSPLFLVIMILILLDSPGPPIFTQHRVGRGGKQFRVYKFRTMVQGSERRGPLTVDNDPRVTKIGKFLRRWSFDELPQLLNVIKGDMSIVGPRAVVPFVVERFNDLERLTLNILPGITGLAQVSGRDAVSFRDKSMLNIYYIRNYSFLLDLKIILRTIRTIVSGEGNL